MVVGVLVIPLRVLLGINVTVCLVWLQDVNNFPGSVIRRGLTFT